jgi:hypothetical protein
MRHGGLQRQEEVDIVQSQMQTPPMKAVSAEDVYEQSRHVLTDVNATARIL